MSENLEQHLTAARERVRDLSRALSRDTMDALQAAWEDQLKAERDLAAARGEQYAQVIEHLAHATLAPTQSWAAAVHALDAPEPPIWRRVGPAGMASYAIPDGHPESAGGRFPRRLSAAAWLLLCCDCL